MAIRLGTNADAAMLGAFMARAAYGAEYIDSAFWVDGDNDAEKFDDYRGYLESQGDFKLLDASDLRNFDHRGGDAGFTRNGLYDARVYGPTSSTFDAQGLLAVKDKDTLVLTFRGTDGKDPAVENGQAFTGAGLASHYRAFKPLINAALDYLKTHDEITNVVVSGHSLGGALADVFALVDADRFRDLRPDGLTIVSVASSGVPKNLPLFLNGIDRKAATLVDKTIVDIFGVEIVTQVIKELHLPPDYVSIVNGSDRAHFPDNYPDIPESVGLVPIVALKNNLQFGGETLFRVPNIDNTDVQYYSPLTHPFDFRGMGAEHNSALLWANLQGLVSDGLFAFYQRQELIAGVTDYNRVPDFNGKPVALFEGYLWLDDRTAKDDRGQYALHGKSGKDYILAMDGDDTASGHRGDDLLSGGRGQDLLNGGKGDDRLSGGLGTDILIGGDGGDRFHYRDIKESKANSRGDEIRDFDLGDDKIDVSDIDAKAGHQQNEAFEFIGHSHFSAEGQIRAVQFGDDTIVFFNVEGSRSGEMAIVLVGVDSAKLTEDHFIL